MVLPGIGSLHPACCCRYERGPHHRGHLGPRRRPLHIPTLPIRPRRCRGGARPPGSAATTGTPHSGAHRCRGRGKHRDSNTTLIFVQSCDARRVIALEPSPTVAPLLRATLALNGVTERVSMHKVAAGDRAVPALLETSSVNFGDKLRGAGALLRSGVPVIAEYWPYALQRSGGLETFEAQVRAHFGAIYDVRSRPRGGTLLPSEEVASLRDQYSERLAYTDLDPSS